MCRETNALGVKFKIGIDINGVLANNKLPYFKTQNYSIFSVMENAINVVKNLVKKYGAENIYIISCVQSHQLSFITGIWMETHNFLHKTNISLDNVIICTRMKDKSRIAEKLNLTHFIDDRPEVLNYFSKETTILVYQPKKSQIKKYPDIASRAIIVNSWNEIADYLKI